MRRNEVTMAGYHVSRAGVVRAQRKDPECPYLRLALAFLNGGGVRLSESQVRLLVDGDGGISAAISGIVEDAKEEAV
mgnify:FL=1